MTQEKIDKVFMSSLGRQLNELYSTSNDMVFIRRYEAVDHSEEEGLDIEEIELWYPSDDVLENDYHTGNM